MRSSVQKNGRGKIYNVSIGCFLKKFCNINIEESSLINHSDMKELFPELKRTSYLNALQNLKLVYTGEIVLVVDNNGYTIPYFAPTEPLANKSTITKISYIINQVVYAVDILIQLSETGVLVIEGNDSIIKDIGEFKKVSNCVTATELANRLITNNYSDKGTLVNLNGNVYDFDGFIEDDNKDLKRLYTKISSISDLLVTIINPDQTITVIVDGKKYDKLDLQSLYAELFVHFKEVKATNPQIQKININGLSYEFMNKYELIELMKYFKHKSMTTGYNVARKELIGRTESAKKYRQEKQKRKEYGEDRYDKY